MIGIGIVTERGTETEGLIGIETTIEESGEKEEDEIDHQGRGAIDLDHLTDGIVIGIEHQTGKLFEPDYLKGHYIITHREMAQIPVSKFV